MQFLYQARCNKNHVRKDLIFSSIKTLVTLPDKSFQLLCLLILNNQKKLKWFVDILAVFETINEQLCLQSAEY
ncbi:MAG: hypothetical protein DCF22_18825 [Leptolyngbya sp.]|nr:MAG: hypothetical protein DCF22_18825 [Leptolyngbya sp.]